MNSLKDVQWFRHLVFLGTLPLIGRYSGIFFECVVTISLEKMVIKVHMAGDVQGSLTVNLNNLGLLGKKS